MKKLALVFATAFVANTGFAQISVTPEIGMNIAKQRTVVGDNDATTSDAAIGLSGGVGVGLPLYKGIYLKTGLFYQKLGGQRDILGLTSTTNLHYLQVPVNVGYRYEISDKAGAVFAEVGPYVGMAISGNTKSEALIGDDIKNDIEFGDKLTETKAMDWGFGFGVGYQSPWGIYLKAAHNLGLGNLSNVDNVTVKNRNWNISLGYRIDI
jgi:hypothetical protein